MNYNSRAAKFSALTLSITALLLSSCGEQSKWTSLYADGQKAAAAGNLEGAAEKYRAAIADAQQHNVTYKLYYGPIVGLGNILLQQGKDAEAVSYLVRALQLGSAVEMPLAENIELLHKLARAEAKIQDWEEAAGTEQSLITLLETEKGPWTHELPEERKFNEIVQAKLIAYREEQSQKRESTQISSTQATPTH
jgi:tetratricopeptide (TPR) repeat protein